MATVTATVQKIEELESKQGNTYWKIRLKGKDYACFKEDAVVGLHEGLSINADVGEKKEGARTSYYFNGYEVADASDVPPKTAPVQVQDRSGPSPQVFEARDRRIAMKAAYASASRYMAALGPVHPEAMTAANLTALARVIYRDVIAAGKGEMFGTKAKALDETPPPPTPDEPEDEAY